MEKRIIKFRALYDDMGGGWRYGMLIYEGEVPRIQEKGTMLFSTCLKGTEGQFTGLLDKSGKEIYEGDVVSYHGDNSAIEFRSGSFGTVEKESGSFVTYSTAWEVIGNIYENSELLTP